MFRPEGYAKDEEELVGDDPFPPVTDWSKRTASSTFFFRLISSSSSLVNSAAIPDPRMDKRKAHAHNASLEGVARERESARGHCTLRERDFNTRCEYGLCEREIERETAHVCADQYFVPFRAPYAQVLNYAYNGARECIIFAWTANSRYARPIFLSVVSAKYGGGGGGGSCEAETSHGKKG